MTEPEVKVLMLKGDKGDGLSDDDMKKVSALISSSVSSAEASINDSLNVKLANARYVPEIFANSTDLKNKYPTGKDGIFITADTGHMWLFVNGNWKDAGVYQRAGVDKTLSVDGVPADAKAVGNELDATRKDLYELKNKKTIAINKGFNFVDFVTLKGHTYRLESLGDGKIGGVWSVASKEITSDNQIDEFAGEMIKGSVATKEATEDATILRIYAQESTSLLIEDLTSDVTTIRNELDATRKDLTSTIANLNKTIHIGRGQTFTRLRDGIAEAIKYPHTTVYVHDGTYDLIEEFKEEIATLETTDKPDFSGCKLENQVHLIFSSGATVKAMYNGVNLNVGTYFAPFYLGNGAKNGAKYKGYTIENLDLECKNTRYAIHDEGGFVSGECITKFINCRLVKHNSRGGEPGYPQCIGGGLAQFQDVEVRNCYFSNPEYEKAEVTVPLVSYHGNGLFQHAKSKITVSNCYFHGTGTYAAYPNGTAPEVSIAYLNNNSFGTSPIDTTADNKNTAIVSWMNETRG